MLPPLLGIVVAAAAEVAPMLPAEGRLLSSLIAGDDDPSWQAPPAPTPTTLPRAPPTTTPSRSEIPVVWLPPAPHPAPTPQPAPAPALAAAQAHPPTPARARDALGA